MARGARREDLAPLGFLERREDLVLTGDVGTVKTHMASALCMPACGRRPEARFLTASSLVMRLRRARDEGRLDREAALIGRARLLAIDELGFLPLDLDVRRRPDGRGGDRPDRAPREARPVPRGVLPRAQRAHAGGVSAQKRCARTVLKLLKNR